jgi:hypothetical protein
MQYLSGSLGGKLMKPKYERPTAIPLGEAAKGSGVCTIGSGVIPGSGITTCNDGYGANWFCVNGSRAYPQCESGTGAHSGGSNVQIPCNFGDNPSTS